MGEQSGPNFGGRAPARVRVHASPTGGARLASLERATQKKDPPPPYDLRPPHPPTPPPPHTHLLPPSPLPSPPPTPAPRRPSTPAARAARAADAAAARAAVLGRLTRPFVPAGDRAYIQDFALYLPPPEDFVPIDRLVWGIRKSGMFSESAVLFMEKVLRNAGLAEKTALTKTIINMKVPGYKPTVQEAIDETGDIAEAVVGDLLKKTGVQPSEIDAVITACSCFSPTPSIASLVVNKFRLRSDCLTFSLGGMGCATSVVCADLAARLLRTMKPGAKVLIFNTENLTNSW